MIDLTKYINNQLNPFKLTEEQKEKLLNLDKEYYDLVLMFRSNFYVSNLSNLDEEYKKFITSRKRGLKYYPSLKYSSYNPDKDKNILDRLEQLLSEFNKFDCFLSKYYITQIKDIIYQVKFNYDKEYKYPWYSEYRKQTPSLDVLDTAYKMLEENPYENVDDAKDRNISGKEAAKIIQDYIDELGYGWKVILEPDMIPRMRVKVDGTMNVNPNAKFSKADIEGLKAHEIRGHVGRRYYGLQTGLYLFCVGLKWEVVFDEGLAVWNSLNEVKHIKPNIKFNIALKSIITYHLDKMDFCELFDMCKKLVPDYPDEHLFKNIIRYKRELQDCSNLGGNGDDQSYLTGYLMVNKMTDEERDDVLKWNIGPDQWCDLPKIKEFFEVNKFKPLKTPKLK